MYCTRAGDWHIYTRSQCLSALVDPFVSYIRLIAGSTVKAICVVCDGIIVTRETIMKPLAEFADDLGS